MSAIPPGVTKRHLDTLISRGNPLSVSGAAVVCCVHGRDKRSVTDMAINVRTHHPHICPCCENIYAKVSDEPGFCPTCSRGSR